MRYRRDPENERRARVVAMRELLWGLQRLDPSNTGSLYFRTGTNAYISLERINNAYVLADLLELLGYDNLGRDLASFARGVQREESLPPGPRRTQRNITTPSREKWNSLVKRIRAATNEINRGEDVRSTAREMSQRPSVKLYTRRVRLNQGGYEYGPRGRYFGHGDPLYYVSSDLVVDGDPAAERVRRGYIDEYVRAANAEDARRKVADKYRIRYKRR